MQTASEIKETRKIHFDRKQELEAQISSLAGRNASTAESLARVDSEIGSFEKELLEREQSSVQRLLSYIGVNRRMEALRSGLGAKNIERVELEERFEKTADRIAEVEKAKADRSYLEKAKTTLAGFYKNQEKKFAEFVTEQQRVRSVSDISKRMDAVFIHGIHPTFVPDQNSLLQKEVDWQTKLNVFLAFKPTVSTSTLREGDGVNRMWARQGLILTDGCVVTASSSDSATVARGIEDRGVWSFKRKMTDRDISDAVHNRGPRYYNEFVVAQPGIAGFYVCRDEKRNGMQDLAPIEEIIAECTQRGISIFEIKNGQVWETKLSPNGRNIIPVRQIHQEELLQKQYSLSELDREKAEQEILNNSPFNVFPAEARYVASCAKGRELYIVLNKKSLLSSKKGEKEVFSDSVANSDTGIKKGSMVTILEEFPTVGEKVRYLATSSGKLYKHTIPSFRPKSTVNPHNSSGFGRGIRSSRVEEISEYKESRVRDTSYIELAFNSHDIRRPVSGVSAYLAGMEHSFQDLRLEKEKALSKKHSNDKRQSLEKFFEEWIFQVVFHLYGFAEQARECGDSETEKKALAMVAGFLPPEQCKEILTRRIDADGRLRIKKEEIRK